MLTLCALLSRVAGDSFRSSGAWGSLSNKTGPQPCARAGQSGQELGGAEGQGVPSLAQASGALHTQPMVCPEWEVDTAQCSELRWSQAVPTLIWKLPACWLALGQESPPPFLVLEAITTLVPCHVD